MTSVNGHGAGVFVRSSSTNFIEIHVLLHIALVAVKACCFWHMIAHIPPVRHNVLREAHLTPRSCISRQIARSDAAHDAHILVRIMSKRFTSDAYVPLRELPQKTRRKSSTVQTKKVRGVSLTNSSPEEDVSFAHSASQVKAAKRARGHTCSEMCASKPHRRS